MFSGATVPSKVGGENEDWAAATSDMVVVLDGATVRTDTGCTHGVSWYARKLGAGILAEAASRSRSLADSLRTAINDVANLHPECDLNHPGTPSAAAAIVRAEGDTLRYLVLGDVTIVMENREGWITTISDDRVSHTAAAERARVDSFPIGSPEKQEALLEMKRAELGAGNRESGYWISAAEPAAVEHALTGEIPIRQVARIAVLTDGATRTVEIFKKHDWTTALDALESKGPEDFIREIRRIEAKDPNSDLFPRNKASDDATAVFAKPSGGERIKIVRVNPRIDHSTEAEVNRRKSIDDFMRRFHQNHGIMGGAMPQGEAMTELLGN